MLDVIFREYDIRGLYKSELNEKSVKTIGYLLGLEIKKRGYNNVSVGFDARYSAQELFDYLLSGLNYADIDVYNLGLVPTPLGYFSLFYGKKFDANIMITGSHNPKDYNGFKITINKESFFGKELKEFGIKVKNNLNLNIKDNTKHQNYDIVSKYIDFISDQFSHLKNMYFKFAIDCANGASGYVILELIKKLNLNAKVLFADPNGNFPNHAPDPTEIKNLKHLQTLLNDDNTFKMGFAFDGDADRLVVLNKDHIFCGDELCYLLAKNIPNPRVLGEVKCSKNLFDEVSKFGTILMSKTGHSNIKKMMQEYNIDLAAEVSGHIFFKHRYFGYDDGIYAFLRVLELIYQGFDLYNMIQSLPKLYASEEIKIPVLENEKFKLINKFIKIIKNNKTIGIKNICEIDGIRIDFGYGWALLRASNTSPYLIARFETNKYELTQNLKTKILSLLEEIRK